MNDGPHPTGIEHPHKSGRRFFRFHEGHAHLNSVYGDDWFALKAEAFARFFGTPKFIMIQTGIVLTWIILNATGVISWDIYPFILLNLGFSLQAAYAAPLILLAQTRQADRDKAHEETAARHRDEIATRAQALLQQNTDLTEQVKELTEHVAELTRSIHSRVVGT